MYKTERAKTMARNKLYAALKSDLEKRGGWEEPFVDKVDRYIALWDTAQLLDEDIKKRGVQIDTEKGLKKNDSVPMLVATNKQMDLMLEKLNISAPAIVKGGGEDI